jgi:putative transposase
VRTGSGAPLRILNVVDEYTRVAVPGRAVHRGPGRADVPVRVVRSAKPRCFAPTTQEFVASSLVDWLKDEGVTSAFIEKGRPPVERLPGAVRRHDARRALNGEEFTGVLEARVVLRPESRNTMRGDPTAALA